MSEENNDLVASSGSIDHAIINKESGVTVSGTTNLPQYFYDQDPEQRGNAASQLFIQAHEDVGISEEVARKFIPDIVKTPGSSSHFEYGNNVIILHSNIYGSVAGGDMHQTMIYVDKWQQVKNEIDPEKLLEELEEAIKLIREKDVGEQHLTDLGHLIFARDELRKADGASVLKHLKKLGGFGREIATSAIGGYLAHLIKIVVGM